MSTIDAIRTSYAIMTNGFDFVMRGLNAGKRSKESVDAEIEMQREEEKKKIIPIYDSRKKIIDYHKEHAEYLGYQNINIIL